MAIAEQMVRSIFEHRDSRVFFEACRIELVSDATPPNGMRSDSPYWPQNSGRPRNSVGTGRSSSA
jgi:hypothetical protein